MLGFISQQGSPEKDPLLLLDALGNGVHPYPALRLQKGVHTAGPWPQDTELCWTCSADASGL